MRHARAAWIASKMPPALEVAQRTITRRGIFSLFFSIKRRKKEVRGAILSYLDMGCCCLQNGHVRGLDACNLWDQVLQIHVARGEVRPPPLLNFVVKRRPALSFPFEHVVLFLFFRFGSFIRVPCSGPRTLPGHRRHRIRLGSRRAIL